MLGKVLHMVMDFPSYFETILITRCGVGTGQKAGFTSATLHLLKKKSYNLSIMDL